MRISESRGTAWRPNRNIPWPDGGGLGPRRSHIEKGKELMVRKLSLPLAGVVVLAFPAPTMASAAGADKFRSRSRSLAVLASSRFSTNGEANPPTTACANGTNAVTVTNMTHDPTDVDRTAGGVVLMSSPPGFTGANSWAPSQRRYGADLCLCTRDSWRPYRVQYPKP
jgi:hypothetical protein